MHNQVVTGVLSTPACLQAGAGWFIQSGIRDPEGGFARYYMVEPEKNARVSTEITGYAISSLVDLYRRSNDPDLLQVAIESGHFLTKAWRTDVAAMPFEWDATGPLPEDHTYFFDCGIIARGLLHLWQETMDPAFLGLADRCCESMLRDFVNATDIHPILQLPGKTPLARNERWSRSSDCYQLKSALAWRQIGEVTNNALYLDAFERTLERSLANHCEFPELPPQRDKVMDRLHAYCYFLEALLSVTDRTECRLALEDGIQRAGRLLREIRPQFLRSDVCAQLLRVRLFAAEQESVKLDENSAAEEADWVARFQIEASDVRFHGGFWFGERAGVPAPFVNPVSAAFCLQALALWHDRQNGSFQSTWHELV